MIRKILYTFLWVSSVLALFSCKKDLGNYTYEDINEVQFPEGFDGKLTAYVNRPFVVKPKLDFTKDELGDTSRYSYEWIYILPITGGDFGIKTLATTKDLNMIIKLNPGTYDSYFRVTDKETGVQFRKRFNLEVRNEFNEGWLLMCEVNNKAQLDMLSLQENGEFIVVNDLLETTGSPLQLAGKPKLVYSYFTGPLIGYGINLDHGLYIGTDQSTDRVHAETFDWQPNYNVKSEILALDLPADFHIDVIKRVSATRAFMLSSDGNAMFYDRSSNMKYGEPLNYENEKGYKLAPFIAVDENGNQTNEKPYFYDVEKRRFMRHNSVFDSKLTTIRDPLAGAKFSFNNTGKDLLYMDWVTFGGGEVHAILKDPASSTCHLACFHGRFEMQTFYGQIASPDIAEAEHFAISPDQGYIYYSIGSKVYQYDKNSVPATNKLVLDLGTDKISLLKFHKFHLPAKYTESNRLWVASYDPTKPEGQNGKLQQYSVMVAAQGITLQKTYSGFGKVASMHYRER
ncbi:PKD-like family lipoprotein [Sphingobacterium lumbrici]|uniref:PKD-like family lipoprotein n=1 Tax=Sphingobacterium lumbrici TaxID=2559600 RepID=UPI00112846BB|nr:PKD-like family lipoprotein [Sphingobacterium lumbrici]